MDDKSSGSQQTSGAAGQQSVESITQEITGIIAEAGDYLHEANNQSLEHMAQAGIDALGTTQMTPVGTITATIITLMHFGSIQNPAVVERFALSLGGLIDTGRLTWGQETQHTWNQVAGTLITIRTQYAYDPASGDEAITDQIWGMASTVADPTAKSILLAITTGSARNEARGAQALSELLKIIPDVVRDSTT